jgi:hypothetical protein
MVPQNKLKGFYPPHSFNFVCQIPRTGHAAAAVLASEIQKITCSFKIIAEEFFQLGY